MSPRISRRAALQTLASLAAIPLARPAIALGSARVVIIGGGFGGASAARWLRRIDPGVDVTLVERNPRFVTCPFSNLMLGGLRTMQSISFDYEKVRAAGVTVAIDTAITIDPTARNVRLAGGTTLAYDRLILSPGVQLNYAGIPGYSEEAAEVMPHAWQAGPQTELLRRQLEAMPDGGLVVIAAPDNPYRCPPGPYERASMIAWYLKQAKPRSKVMILDAKDAFSKQPLFMEAWKTLYPGMVEWVSKSNSGRVTRVDAKSGTVTTDFDDLRPAVANIIPPQRAGQIAIALGLDQGKGFCPIDPVSFESPAQRNIHLVGDAIIAGAMPKSGFSANAQAKACAHAVAAMLAGRAAEPATLINTCYSAAAPDYGFSVGAVYRPNDQGIFAEIPGAAGTSPLGAPREMRAAEAAYAESWYSNITADMFG